MVSQIAYIIGVVANATLFAVCTRWAYRCGVKHGVRNTVIKVLKDDGIVNEISSDEEK
jgi:hypothetical protein